MSLSLSQYPAFTTIDNLAREAVTATFTNVVYNACNIMTIRRPYNESVEATQDRLLITVRSVLDNSTRSYGITMSEENAAAWSEEISNFIVDKFYDGETILCLPRPIPFPWNVIPETLFQSMIENFNPNNIKRWDFITLAISSEK